MLHSYHSKLYKQCRKSNRNSIEFSLSTLTWSGFKSLQLKSYTRTRFHFEYHLSWILLIFILILYDPQPVVITITNPFHTQPGPWLKGTLQSVRDCRWRYSTIPGYHIQDLTSQAGGVQQDTCTILSINLVLCSIVSSTCREVMVTFRRPSRVGISLME